MSESTSKNQYVDASRALQEKQRQMVSDFFREASPDFMEDYTQLLDDYFRRSFENSMIGPHMGIEKNPYAIIALGGYGRQEQCVHSDVDILFLFKKALPQKAEALIREIIYPLWDIGLDIGHATRSLKECISLASKDFEVLMSLLDARFVCGMSPLYSEMVNKVREKIVFRRKSKIIDWMTASTRERHRLFGESAYLLEPNLKEGRGGLRDYHAMLWLARVRFDLENPRDLEYHGHLSHEEFQDLEQALDFVWNVRSGLHILAGRKYDQLHFENQVALAERFGYRQDLRQHAVERFMGALHGQMDVIKQTHLRFFQSAARTRRRFRFKRTAAGSRVGGLEVRRQTLAFTSVRAILDAPDILVRIFEESAGLGLPIAQEAARLVREFRHRIAGDVVRSRRAVRALEAVLLQPSSGGYDVLGEMHTTGVLLQFVPELADVLNRIEYDTYHIYPVDRHLLKTVAEVSRFIGDDGGGEGPASGASAARDLCRTLFTEISDRRLLAWAALLHDIGKGIPERNHAEAGEAISRSVLERLGYASEAVETVAFLVRSHQVFLHTATRRDIDNEETVLIMARQVGDAERLKMLYLLSVADLRATGPKAWSEWNATLLRSLFLKVLEHLTEVEPLRSSDMESVQEKTRDVLAALPDSRDPSEAASLFGVMSQRYLLSTPAPEIQDHIDLFRRLGDKPFVWKIDKKTESDTRKVVVLGGDQPGFFADIAGVFTLNRIDVLDAQIHTWRNNIVLCIFTVTPPPDPIFEEERWARAAQELSAVIQGKLDIRQALGESPAPAGPPGGAMAVPDRILVDNTGSGFFTIIEVHTRDTPGLLYRLTHALFECGLDIWSAQIATRADQVVDVFYVRDFDGRKIESAEEIERVRSRIGEALPPAQDESSPCWECSGASAACSCGT